MDGLNDMSNSMSVNDFNINHNNHDEIDEEIEMQSKRYVDWRGIFDAMKLQLSTGGISIVLYVLLSFCLGFIKEFNFPFSFNNLKTLYKPERWQTLVYDIVSVISGRLLLLVVLFFLMIFKGLFSNAGVFMTSDAKGKFVILIWWTIFLIGPNLYISLMNWLLSIAFNVKLPLMSRNTKLIIAHQGVIFLSHIMGIILTEGGRKVIRKIKQRRGGGNDEDEEEQGIGDENVNIQFEQ